MYKQLKKRLLLLLVCGVIGTVSGQAVLKVGSNPYLINKNAVLDVESTTKGLLPPRMTKVQRDAIASPPAGLLVWCNDCNTSTEPVSGGLCVYLGSGWSPFTTLSGSSLTTGKKSEANAPVRVSATSATIKGVLVSNTGATPTETGVVWKEIIGTDFATLPLLDNAGAATVPTYKTVGTLVTTDGATITVTIPTLTSTASSARPYYFRTYLKTALGIGYGNPVIFNCAPPTISTPVVTGGTTLLPTFAGTLTVNAGTPQGTVTEYGYCSGTTTNPTTANNKVVLSTPTTVAALNTTLNSETFSADPTVDLAVANYNTAALGTTYFRYYVIANGVTTYSPQATFAPVADAVTGGTAVATVASISSISAAPKIGVATTSTITVAFTVTKAGTYASFVPGAATGATTGITLGTQAAGSFALGAQSLTFSFSGTPDTSLAGNSFVVPRIGTLSTGLITPGDIIVGNAICNGTRATTVVPITSTTGKIWMDRNLGASRAAIAATDHQAYGCGYQWGRGNDGHASITWTGATAGTPVNGSTTTVATTDSPGNALFITTNTTPKDWRSPQNNALWQGAGGINNPCPAGYRVPTNAEITAEITAYSITNSATAYASLFKFVLAGSGSRVDGSLVSMGSIGYLWGSTVSSTNASTAYFTSATTASYADVRAYGFSVRCIKD